MTSAKSINISSGLRVRDKWVNLCIDLNSFVKRCFSKQPSKLEEKHGQNGSQHNLARASGDIGALINKQTLDGHFVSPSLSEK